MDLMNIIKDDVERRYFNGLLSQVDAVGETLSIHTEDNPSGLYPTAIAPKELLDQLPYTNYEDVREKFKVKGKLNATLWLKKMHGGVGSSIDRKEYLQSYGRENVGAKGTDLFIKTREGNISIAKAQIVQAIKKKDRFERIIYQDIVNEDVKSIVDQIWEDKSLSEIERFPSLTQANVPTIDENGELTLEREAPAGHGLFGYEVIESMYDDSRRPSGENIILCIGNGEDLSSTPDRSVTNWMLKEEIPVCMLTTTKTQNDMKGGQIALRKSSDGKILLTIIEKAQAEKSDQLELFEKLGLRESDQDAFFNTNLVLINVDVLRSLLKDKDKNQILDAAIPNLIKNTKEQNYKKYTQLEGAMGSVFLNLDAYWRENFNKPLVHILNIPVKYRTRFFSPIKTPFDYFMQFHSDRFTFNEETYHLVNNNTDYLPMINLPKDYKNLTNVLNDFKNCKILELKKLNLQKRTDLSGKELSQEVLL
ncbi:MAG: UTP--glucose-1-phosphate uridylyltransferase [Bdellovibrionota bacterium]|nr:UTP--glucose-1-phosphate uridylyltransferase [Bdellovibrionota bacterium]